MKENPVSITGMHRSGTSMVANVLRLCGLYLGPDDRLVPPGFDNPGGFWEHAGFVAVNNELLAAYDAAMDWPPPASARWESQEALSDVGTRAEALISGFVDQEAWGWKDPRTSLTLPFWRRFFPDMPVVLCLRNPFEVALSLHSRNGYTITLGLNLWQIYNQRVLRLTDRQNRIVTHYDAFFHEPEVQINRLVDFLGLSPSAAALQQCREAVRPSLRHRRLDIQHLVDVGLAPDLLHLYAALCQEAEWFDHEDRTGGRVIEALTAQRQAPDSAASGTSTKPHQGSNQSTPTDAMLLNPTASAAADVQVQPGYSQPRVDALLLRGEVKSLRRRLAARDEEVQSLGDRLAATEAELKEGVQLRTALSDELLLLRDVFWTLATRTEVAGTTHAAIDTVAGQPANGPRPIFVAVGQSVRVEGWAIDTEAAGTAGGVLVVVDGQQRFRANYGHDRPDVADGFDQPAFTRCGFRADLPFHALPPGPHTLTLEVIAKDRPAYYSAFRSAETDGAPIVVNIEVKPPADR